MSSVDELPPFTRVFDVDDDAPMVVLQTLTTTADEFTLAPDITLADVWPTYPAADPVVCVVYEGLLESMLVGWHTVDPQNLACAVADAHPEIRSWYPRSKLEVYTAGNFTEVGDSVRCEFCRGLFESTPEWADHLAGGACP